MISETILLIIVAFTLGWVMALLYTLKTSSFTVKCYEEAHRDIKKILRDQTLVSGARNVPLRAVLDRLEKQVGVPDLWTNQSGCSWPRNE